VIIHGWSDRSASFIPLAQALSLRLKRPVTTISLADWESTNDQVTYDDLITRMDLAWTAAGLPRDPHSVDVVVHSTGGLVIRDWLLRNFGLPRAASLVPGLQTAPTADNPSAAPTTDTLNPDSATLAAQTSKAGAAMLPPVKHLVMLAPANFGSPLAHKGSSFIGRVVKGWNPGEMLQVGAQVLKGLELGSTYTWTLAQADRFGSINFYAPGNVLATVLVGNTGYSGIAAAANEPGSDGTVRVSTANLNAVYITADLTDPVNPSYAVKPSAGKAGFRVMDGMNHMTVHDPAQKDVLDAIVAGLQVDDDGFVAYCKDLDQRTADVLRTREAQSNPYFWGYQNTVFFVRDQFFRHVTNYFIEFFNDHESNFLEELFHHKVLQDVHAFSDDNAYRAMLIDTKTLAQGLQDPNGDVVKISLTAEPEFSINKVGYSTLNDKDIGAVTLSRDEALSIFQPNRTVFVEIIIRRRQQDGIFAFKASQ
jgi:hypothetical protein